MFSKQLNPGIDCTELKEAPIVFHPIWKDYLIACKNGVDVTAWTRYMHWYKKVISNHKDNPNADSGALGSRSHGCPKRKRISVSLPPPRRLKRLLSQM
jgi:hypothetical protein